MLSVSLNSTSSTGWDGRQFSAKWSVPPNSDWLSLSRGGRAVRNFDEGGPASGGATRLGRDSIVALAALAREWVALNGIAVCAPRTYRSGRNGTSIARINGRSGVPFTSMRLPQQASSDTPRA